MLKEIVATDEARDQRKATAPAGMANAVDTTMSILHGLGDSSSNNKRKGEAYDATSDSNS